MATTFRFTRVPGDDNAPLLTSRENQAPTYASAMVFTTVSEKTKCFIALTGALALTATNTHGDSKKGDEVDFCFSADGSARTVTPGAGFAGLSASTIVCGASKTACLSCYFDGTNWIEKSRTVGA